MEYSPLYFGTKNITIVYLQRYLNEILRLDPPLAETGEFDNNLSDAIIQFLTRYNSLYPDKKLPMTRVITNELFAAVGVMLGEKRLAEEVKVLGKSQPVVAKLLQSEQLFVIPPYTVEMKACDKKLAEIFGGRNAVAAGSAFEPENLYGTVKGKPEAKKYRGGKEDGGHFFNAMHLYYGDDEGKNAGEHIGDVFVPAGGKYIGPNTWTVDDEGSHLWFYAILGSVRNVILTTSHIQKFQKPQDDITKRRTLIGQIGGKGGEDTRPINPKKPFSEGGYIHSHFTIFSNAGYNAKTKQWTVGKRISFFEVFCK